MSRPPGRVRGFAPLAAAMVGAGAVLAWLLGQESKPVLAYLGSAVTLLGAAAACQRIGSEIVVPRPVRGFWKGMSHASIWLFLAEATAALTSGGSAPVVSPYTGGLLLIGVLLAVFAIVRLPLGRRTALGWLQVALDGATVAVAGFLIFFYLVFDLAAPGTPVVTSTATAVVGVSGLLAVVVIGKAAVAPAGPVDSWSLRILTIAPLVGTVSAAALIVGTEPVRVVTSLSVLPLVGLSICAGAYRQLWALGSAPRDRPDKPGRSLFNLLPFIAVTATAGMVVVVSAGRLSWHDRMVIIGAVLIAGLVVLRQLTLLHENLARLSDLRRQQADLEQIALHDSLTGLANRAAFSKILAERLAGHRPAAVLLIDVDDFKMVNDSMGHAVGDQLIYEVSQRLRAYCRAVTDLPARLGGDEFAVLLDADEPEHAELAAARVLETLTLPFAVGPHQLLVQASVGVAPAGPGDTADEVLRNADIAMYAAKAAGKASWVRFEPRMRLDVLNQARVGSELRNALLRGELFLLYQPVFDLATGLIAGAEALVRWNHPVRGLVAPVDFIPVAERSGLIVPLGSWVLREACEQLARWKADLGPAAISSVNVNVAARQLADATFGHEVAGVLEETGLKPENLVIEVTESMVVTGRQVRETLQELHEMGVRLALDDFGTGQSSLSLVRAFPVNTLKLDKSFVDGICEGTDRGRLAVAAAVAQLADYLELATVAEGIETEAQADRLRAMGYQYGQGYHLARPMPADEVANLMVPLKVG